MAPLFALASVLVQNGRAIITNLLSGLGGTVPKYIAWGTGAGTAATTDTTLFTESSEARVAGSVGATNIATAGDAIQVQGTLTASGAKTITNAGLFDASSGGSLFVHADFTGVVLAAGDGIFFNWRVEFA
jgi:hypothetical protein